MTPAARAAAAADILDRISEGAVAEQALTNWARASRFAGSGDRAAVRDLVFGALRRRRSLGARAGAGDAATGRQLMLGTCLADGTDPAAVFTGAGHAPLPLSSGEAAALAGAVPEDDWPEAVALDCPDWAMPLLRGALGPDTDAVLRAMQARATVFLRVNSGRTTRGAAADALAAEGIATTPHPLADTALAVTSGAPKLRRTAAYLDGRVELQDAASQAAAAMVRLRDGDRVLDFCAGGGGKTLALAARAVADGLRVSFLAHDAQPVRMADLPARAARAGLPDRSHGVNIRFLGAGEPAAEPPFDLVLVDAPCSGSGTWARGPDAKWRLSPAGLQNYVQTQAQILDEAMKFVAEGRGQLVYMTCSLFPSENRGQVDAFVARHPGWRLLRDRQFTPLEGGDGFYAAVLARSGA